MVFNYTNDPDGRGQFVRYRPALLNGRHNVDVVRAVCGPADVSEAELDYARKKAAQRAKELNHQSGVWLTGWCGAVVTAQM